MDRKSSLHYTHIVLIPTDSYIKFTPHKFCKKRYYRLSISHGYKNSSSEWEWIWHCEKNALFDARM